VSDCRAEEDKGTPLPPRALFLGRQNLSKGGGLVSILPGILDRASGIYPRRLSRLLKKADGSKGVEYAIFPEAVREELATFRKNHLESCC